MKEQKAQKLKKYIKSLVLALLAFAGVFAVLWDTSTMSGYNADTAGTISETVYGIVTGRINCIYSADILPPSAGKGSFLSEYWLWLAAAGAMILLTLLFAHLSIGRCGLKRELCKMITLAVCVAAGCTALYAAVSEDDILFVNSRAEDLISQMRYGRFDGDEQVQLEVSMSEPSPYYLRGFVGESYEGGVWTELSGTTRTDAMGLFARLHERGFYAQTALSSAAANLKTTENLLRIKNTGASRKYLYAPYETISIGAERKAETGDRTFLAGGAWGEDTYTISAGTYLVHRRRDILDALPEGEAAEAEYNYRLFAEKNYLAISDDNRQKVMHILDEYTDLDKAEAETKAAGIGKTDAAKSLILTVLQEDSHCFSSLPDEFSAYAGNKKDSPDAKSAGEAAAAVLLFRSLGVPARYAEGYLITEEAAEEAADFENSTVKLTGEDYHAWCEYYEDGIGWLPFESDPALRCMMKNDDVLINAGKDTESEMQEPEKNTGQEQKPAGSNEMSTQEEGLNLLWYILCLALIIAAITAILRKALRRRKYLRLKPEDAVIFSMEEALQSLKKKGLPARNRPLSHYEEEIGMLWGEEFRKEYRKAAKLYDSIRYGEASAGNTEKEEMHRFAMMAKKLKKTGGKRKEYEKNR